MVINFLEEHMQVSPGFGQTDHPAKVPNSLSDNENSHVFTVVGFKLALLFGEKVGTCVSINISEYNMYTISYDVSSGIKSVGRGNAILQPNSIKNTYIT